MRRVLQEKHTPRPFLGEGDEVVVPAIITPRSGRAVGKNAAFQILAKRLADIALGLVVHMFPSTQRVSSDCSNLFETCNEMKPSLIDFSMSLASAQKKNTISLRILNLRTQTNDQPDLNQTGYPFSYEIGASMPTPHGIRVDTSPNVQ
jgi:hypothetical protein